MNRRDFLATAASLPLLGCAPSGDAALPGGDLSGGKLALAHRLREGRFSVPDQSRRTSVLIVGAGIAGLSAAWKLDRSGLHDFMLYELEDAPGGNARFGQNPVSAFPLGAHYLPLPTLEARAVRELLADLGAIAGDPYSPRPRYDELLLCATPQERVYRDGIWQDGLLPRLGVPAAERAQGARFQARMDEFRAARDARGRRAFALPVAHSSPDRRWRDLDRITMRQWLLDNGFNAAHLHWYVNYCCRDDFGTDYCEVSAWAGIHYFACRNGEAENAASDTVLTAPEGNGWIIKRLAPRFADRTVTGALACLVRQNSRSASADFFLARENRMLRIEAEHVIWAAPPFVLPQVAADLPAPLAQACRAETAPWLVANLTLKEAPYGGAGAPLAWDNVLYDSPALGYVVSTHQRLSAAPGPTVLTYYHALSAESPALARRRLLDTPHRDWVRGILADLGRAHSRIASVTTRIDIHRHGHAMVRPVPGVLFSETRRALQSGWGRVHFAHADVGGLSVFEEANYRGVLAAERILKRLGVRFPSSLG